DLRVTPQRIEVEVNVAAAVLRMVPELLAPVGAIGQFRRRPDHAAHVGRERAKGLNEREGTGFVPKRGEPAQFATEQEGIDTTGRDSEVSVVKDEAPVAPIVCNSRKYDRIGSGGKLAGMRCATECFDLQASQAASICRARLQRRRITGDAAAPGIRRLE